MPASYRYAAEHLGQSNGRWNVQKKNMGMLEVDIERIVPGGQGILIMSLKSVTLPGRTIAVHTIDYLNGSIKFPGKPAPQGDMSVVFRDYIDSMTRAVLESWYDAVYDEFTGLMRLSTSLKTRADLVLFGSDGVSGLRKYTLEGLFPTSRPGVNIDMASGEQDDMAINFNVDVVKAVLV